MDSRDLLSRVATILADAQESAASHPRLTQDLTRICEAHGAEKLWRHSLFPAIQNIFTVLKREPAVERVATFLIQFLAGSLAQINGRPLSVVAMLQLLPYMDASTGARDTELSKAVRFRSTQFVAGILNSLHEETELKNDVWALLESRLVTRASDKVTLIRINAVLGLSRLQDVEDCANEASKAFLRLLTSDPTKEVRRTALKHLVVSRHTLQAIIDRVRDVNADVRVEALRSLTANVKMRSLSIQQRLFIIQSGLADRDPTVKAVCVELCLEWLKAQGSSVPTLLKAFDVENTEDKAIEQLLEAILENVSMERIEWRSGTMTPELAVLWRYFVQWQNKKKNSHLVESNLPDSLIEYCELITTVSTELMSGYILRQVLQLAPLMDKADEGGRRAVVGLLSEVAAENFVTEVDVEHVVRAISVFSFGMNDFVERMLEAIKRARVHLDVFEQEESQDSIERQNARIKELKRLLGPSQLHFIARLGQEDNDDAEEEEEEEEEEEVSADIAAWKEELKMLIIHKNNRQHVTEWSWVRTLSIVQHLFSYTTAADFDESKSSLAENLLSLIPRYLAGGMAQTSILVRVAAIKAVGALAIVDVRRNVVSNVELLYHALSNDELEVRVEALKVLFDMVFMAGFEVFTATPEKKFVALAADYVDPSYPHEYPDHSIFSVLFQYLRSDEEVLQTTAVEGFTKLLASKKLVDARTLAELLVLLFDPATGENAVLQQSLSLFMPMYAFASYKNQELIAESFKCALQRLVHADSESSLAEAHVPTFMKFLLHLVDAGKLREMHAGQELRIEKSLQNALAIDVAQEILVAPGSRSTKVLVKFFDCYTVDYADVATIRRLEHLVRKVAESIKTDKVSLKAMETLVKTLADNISNTIPALTEESVDELAIGVKTSTKRAIAQLDATKAPVTQKKLPPKSSKKLVSSRARVVVDLDSSESELELSDSEEVVAPKPKAKVSSVKRVGRALLEDFVELDPQSQDSVPSTKTDISGDSDEETIAIEDGSDLEVIAPEVQRANSAPKMPASKTNATAKKAAKSTASKTGAENDKTRSNAKAKAAAAAPPNPAKAKSTVAATTKTTSRAAKMAEKARLELEIDAMLN